jgi:hypothetical protein
VSWNNAGGQAGTDYAATPLVSIAGFDPSTTPAGTQITFPSTPALAAAVSNAVRALQPFDVLLEMTNDNSGGSVFARLASDDHGTVSRRPRLTLTLGYSFAPAVDVGAVPVAYAGLGALLNGAVSNTSASVWSQVSGPGVAWFANAALPATTVTFDQPGNYVLRLAASNVLAECWADLPVTVATLSPPQLGGATVSNGPFQFAISGPTGVLHTIESSTNLVTWNPVSSTNPATTPFLWRDTNTSLDPQRFYRVRVGPNP